MAGSSTQNLSTAFFGRATELDTLAQEVRDPAPRAVLVIGQPGMGKSQLVQRFGEMMAAGLPGVRGSVVQYEVTAQQSAQSVMASMVRDAYHAAQAERPFFSGDERKWKALLTAVGTIPIVGSQLKSLAELLASWAPDERKDARDELIARLTAISERTSEDTRLVFVIDAARELSPASDVEWALVVRKLPPKLKFIFTQRPNDVIASSPEFRGLLGDGLARRIPETELGVLDGTSLQTLVEQYALEVGASASDLAACVDRFDAHPYAVHAALNLIATAAPDKRESEMARVRALADPTPMGIAREQFRRACEIGPTAAKLLEAYAVLDAAAPDELACVVAEIDATEHRRLMADRYFSTLLREEAGDERGRRLAIYHAILVDSVRGEIKEARAFHARAMSWFEPLLDRAKKQPTPDDGYPAVQAAKHAIAALEGPHLAMFINNVVFETLLRVGELRIAKAALEESVRRSNDLEIHSVCLSNLGMVEAKEGNLTIAEQRFKAALAISKKLGRHDGIASDYGNLGNIEFSKGEYIAAREYHKKSLAIDEQRGFERGQAASYGNLGLVEQQLGNQDVAEEYFRKALKIYAKLGNQEGMAASYGNLGSIEKTRKALDRAEEYFKKSLVMNERIGRLEGIANQCGNLGVLECMRERWDSAEAYLTRALELNERLNRVEGVAIQYGNLGVIERSRGNLDAAARLHLRAMYLDRQLGNLPGIARHLGNLGLIAMSLQDLNSAERFLQDALAIEERVGHSEGVANQHANLGTCASRRGDPAEAARLWTLARDRFALLGARADVDRIQSWLNSLPPEPPAAPSPENK